MKGVSVVLKNISPVAVARQPHYSKLGSFGKRQGKGTGPTSRPILALEREILGARPAVSMLENFWRFCSRG